MTYIEKLEAIRDATADKMVAHMAADTKATYSVDGRSFDWAGYRAQLMKQLDEVRELIRLDNGPQEQRTIALG